MTSREYLNSIAGDQWITYTTFFNQVIAICQHFKEMNLQKEIGDKLGSIVDVSLNLSNEM